MDQMGIPYSPIYMVPSQPTVTMIGRNILAELAKISEKSIKTDAAAPTNPIKPTKN